MYCEDSSESGLFGDEAHSPPFFSFFSSDGKRERSVEMNEW